jgi:DNA-binding transcriptional MerR regulator
VIPSIAPQKDLGNRRVYTQRDLQTVKRLGYLINEKKFTIEGARAQQVG